MCISGTIGESFCAGIQTLKGFMAGHHWKIQICISGVQGQNHGGTGLIGLCGS